MYVKSLKLENFRNYDNLSVEFHPGVNILIGDNAQGKTNLIEAIYMMSFAKSFRTRKDRETINFNRDYARIDAVIAADDEDQPFSMLIKPDSKYISYDGVKVSKMTELLEKVYVVIFSPEDLKLVKDSPDRRRKFIDRELSKLKPLYYENLYNYKKVLKQRNAYLKEDNIQTDILRIWDYKLAEYGSEIIKKRNDFIKKLEEVSSEIHSSITSGKETLTVEYEANIPYGENLREEFLAETEKNLEKDLFQRTTSKGPHKDDLKICINGVDIRHFGSQGQQRTAALSLKLAEIRLVKEMTGEDAVLLLDDVLSELDRSRQSYLVNCLNTGSDFYNHDRNFRGGCRQFSRRNYLPYQKRYNREVKYNIYRIFFTSLDIKNLALQRGFLC